MGVNSKLAQILFSFVLGYMVQRYDNGFKTKENNI